MMQRRHPLPRWSLLAGGVVLCVLNLRCASRDNASSSSQDNASGLGPGLGTAGASAAASTGTGRAATTAAGSGGRSSGGGATGAGGSAGGTGGAAAGGSAGTGGSPSAGGTGVSAGSSMDAGADSGAAASRPGWTLVFSDEFDGPKGTAVDGSKWNLVNKGDGFGNNELEFYTNRKDNAALDGNGFLVITAKKEAYMGRDYTSARLESNGKLERAYGRVEARIKIPRGQGIWPAFWMLGNDISSVSWPQCGEIDIMENIGKEPSTIHGSLHGPGYSGGNPLGAAYALPSGENFADAFHVFAIEWETNVIRFYVDDNLYETRTPADVPANGHWVYDHPFFLLLNVAVGGQWPGSPDDTTTFPQTMTVDYVRVYGR